MLYFYIFLLGITIGSFLNVVIYRVPNGISVAAGRSFCPSCKETLRSYDLIPIVSYLALGGKCRVCKTKISPRYPIIELLSGILAIGSVWLYGFHIDALVLFVISTILLCISLVDYDTMTIPDALLFSLLPVAIVLPFLDPSVGIVSRIIGFFAISLPMYGALYLIEDCFGGADIKLFAILGFILGWKNILLTFFIAIILAAICSVVASKIKKEDYKGKHIPFGPYICLGAFIAMIFGHNIIEWYSRFF
ncbi:MAG: prepilin peptidase [Eubacteriales bacterium]|nr:prepilin peptidase [Eubacteriales bacterium]